MGSTLACQVLGGNSHLIIDTFPDLGDMWWGIQCNSP